MSKKVIVVGSEDEGKQKVNELLAWGVNETTIIHHIEKPTPMKTIEVQGELYIKKERPKPRYGKGIMQAMVTTSIVAGVFDKSTQVPGVYSDDDFIEEYKLILEKKSKLSKNNRDKVERWFHINFEKLENDNI